MNINEKSKYLAIKVEGLPHWLWFDRSKTSVEDGIFTGVQGWGEDGAQTDIECDVTLIKSEIASESLQYEQ